MLERSVTTAYPILQPLPAVVALVAAPQDRTTPDLRGPHFDCPECAGFGYVACADCPRRETCTPAERSGPTVLCPRCPACRGSGLWPPGEA